jgi:DNA polymerase delta subunit 2
MLEDESGRLRLTGNLLQSTQLATGAIIAVLGTENANGDFETIDIRVPDLPPQPRRWERDEDKTDTKESRKGKIAFGRMHPQSHGLSLPETHSGLM